MPITVERTPEWWREKYQMLSGSSDTEIEKIITTFEKLAIVLYSEFTEKGAENGE